MPSVKTRSRKRSIPPDLYILLDRKPVGITYYEQEICLPDLLLTLLREKRDDLYQVRQTLIESIRSAVDDFEQNKASHLTVVIAFRALHAWEFTPAVRANFDREYRRHRKEKDRFFYALKHKQIKSIPATINDQVRLHRFKEVSELRTLISLGYAQAIGAEPRAASVWKTIQDTLLEYSFIDPARDEQYISDEFKRVRSMIYRRTHGLNKVRDKRPIEDIGCAHFEVVRSFLFRSHGIGPVSSRLMNWK